MKQKILITGINHTQINKVAHKLIEINDSFGIAPYFTTDEQDINDNKYYIDINTINISYKNNSLLFVNQNDNIYEGITIDDFYNNDISVIEIKDINNISNKIFNSFDILVVWVDTKTHNMTKMDYVETNYLESRLEGVKYLYFIDDDPEYISDIIIKYLNSSDDIKRQILFENS